MKKSKIAVASHLENLARVNLAKVQSPSSGIGLQPSTPPAFQAAFSSENRFLKPINLETMVAMASQKSHIGLGSLAGQMPTGTTRAPTDNIKVTNTNSLLQPVQYDSFFSGQQFNNGARSPEFAQHLGSQIKNQIGIDIPTIGFNGLAVRPTTDRAKNPPLQDLDRWLQAICEEASSQALGSTAEPIKERD